MSTAARLSNRGVVEWEAFRRRHGNAIVQESSPETAAAKRPGSGSLQRQVVASGGWLFGLRFGERLLGLLRTVVLARLLAPDDFGLFGIAVLAMSMVETLSKTGFEEAIIQLPGSPREHLGTAWSVHVLRGTVLAGLLWAGAPMVGAFFEAAAAVSLLRAMSLNLVLVGLTNTGVAMLQKELRFGRYAAHSGIGTFVDIVVSVIAAWFLRDAWALVYGMLAGSAARLVASWLLADAVRPRFDFARFRELAGFGGWVWVANALHFAADKGHDFVVARMLGVPPLGVYRMAFAYAGVPATEITHVVSRVTFPAYARLRDNIAGLRRGYLKTVQTVALISAPLSLGIAAMAPSFVRVVLEPVWEPLVLPLQILALGGLLRSLSAATGPVLLGIGRPQLVTRLVGVKLGVLLLAIFPLTSRFGLPGTAVAAVLSTVVSFPLAAYVVARLIECPVGAYVRTWAVPVGAAVVMYLAIVRAHASLPDFGIVGFVASILGGAILYAALVLLVGPRLGYVATAPFTDR